MTEIHFKITNITCAACVKLSSMALRKLPGFGSVEIDDKSGSALLKSEQPIPFEEIASALKAVGKNAEQI